MVKDRKARRDNRITVMALANLLAAMLDAMREADVPNDIIHHFLDRLERMNALTLNGPAADLMGEFVEVMRGSVASND